MSNQQNPFIVDVGCQIADWSLDSTMVDGQKQRPRVRWVVYTATLCDLQEAQRPGSEYNAQTRRVLDRFTRYRNLVPRFLDEIPQDDVAAYIGQRRRDTWRGNPPGVRTLNNEIDIINHAFAKAGPKTRDVNGRDNFGYIDDPPFISRLKGRDKHETSEPVEITIEQLQRFLAAAQDAQSPRSLPPALRPKFWEAATLLDLVTSLRRRALLLIPRPSDEILLGRQEIILPPWLNKNKHCDRPLRISLGSQEIVDVLAELPTKPGEPLLPWKHPDGRPMGLGHFSNMMAEIQRKAGISEDQRIRTKDLRSTAANLVSEGFGDPVARRKLGHSPNTHTLETNYLNYRLRPVDREASAALGAMVLPLLHRDRQLKLFEGEAS